MRYVIRIFAILLTLVGIAFTIPAVIIYFSPSEVDAKQFYFVSTAPIMALCVIGPLLFFIDWKKRHKKTPSVA